VKRGSAGTLGLLIGLTLLATGPALPFLTTRVIGDGGDAYQFLGFQYLAKRLVFSGHFPFGWTDYWRYPHGIDFQSTYDSSLLVLIGLPLYAATGHPVLVYNLSVLIILFLNVSLSYVAFRTWFARDLALVGAVVYGLSFYTLARMAGHPNLVGTAGFLLFFASLYTIHRDGRGRDFALLAGSSLYLAYASLQYPLILLGSLLLLALPALIMLPGVVPRLATIVWSSKVAVTASACGLVAGVALFHGQKLFELVRGRVVMPPTQFVVVPPLNFIVANPYLPTAAALINNGSEREIESCVFFGYLEILLVAVAIAKLKPTPLKRFLISAIVILFGVSLGHHRVLSALWPYPYLYKVLPFRGIFEPGRFSIVLYLAMTVLLLLYLQQLKSRRWVLILSALLVAERLPVGLYLSPTLDDPALPAAVGLRETRAVLDLPIYTSWWNGQLYDLFSVYYERPIVNGYVHWSGDQPRSRILLENLREFACSLNPGEPIRDFDPVQATHKRAQILATLAEHAIRVVVVHKDLIGSKARCGEAARHIDFLVEDGRRWELLLDTPAKRVLWLRTHQNADSSAGVARARDALGGGREERAVRRVTTVGRGAQPPSEDLAAGDELPSQSPQVVERAHDHAQPRAGLDPGLTRVVVHAHLADPNPTMRGAGVELGVDQGTRRFEGHARKGCSRDELEGAVEITHPDVEQETHQPAEQSGIERPQHGVASPDPEAAHDAVRAGQGKQAVEVVDVELPVAVHVEDVRLARRLESRAQRGAVAPVLRMVPRPQAGKPGGETVQDLAGPIAAAVVDDDDLVVETARLEKGDDTADHAVDVRLFVERRQHDRQLSHPVGMPRAHMAPTGL
jgi:hypothetical protein